MVQRLFQTDEPYLHIPIWCGEAEKANYIQVVADNARKNEFLIAICPPGKKPDLYVAMDVRRYDALQISLQCDDEDAPGNLFDAILPGPHMTALPELYPNLYREENRQQIHFSPARGWMNDPNGLVYADGVFHMYFQHNPFANHHFGVNVSWGHAVSTDGVHFTEQGDALMPKNSRVHVASGSAIVDKYNLSGKGVGTIIATYTDLESAFYRGRVSSHNEGGQNLLYSTDGGQRFTFFSDEHIIPVPEGEYWRDPKILQLDEDTFCIAVYETYEGRNCVSFYTSSNCTDWVFRSRTMDLYECPDLFPLKAVETGEAAWVLYGANGQYRVGEFKNYQFYPNGDWGLLDYGDAVYAGQTFNNYDDPHARLHFAWLRDHEKPWEYAADEPHRVDGFSQSMSLLCRLELHKTEQGFRLFRKPIDAISQLRKNSSVVCLDQAVPLPVPGEAEFLLDRQADAEILFGGRGFRYDAKQGAIHTSSGKEYILSGRDPISVRLVVDTRSVEFFVADQISMSYSVNAASARLSANCAGTISATVYELESIWKNITGGENT